MFKLLLKLVKLDKIKNSNQKKLFKNLPEYSIKKEYS